MVSVSLFVLMAAVPAAAQQQDMDLPPELVRQVSALLAEKAQRTPAQQKVSSRLLHAAQIEFNEIIADDDVALRMSTVEPDGTVDVDIRADVTPEVFSRIDALGGSVISAVPQYGAVRARLPLEVVEALAELDAVQSIRPADEAVMRSQILRTAVGSDPAAARKVDTSEGDVAHRVDQARRQYSVDGTGIGIGVVSDGVDSLAARQASGDLPATVTVIPGQARPGGSTGTHDEGTAMLEIVHDLAPGADLYFATGFNGTAAMAANIEALCRAGANVIVDDIGYFRDAVFQDGTVARGVNAAVANGCIHFSSVGNDGNFNDGTSGVAEGDFVADSSTGRFHVFSGVTALNRITQYEGSPFCLKWSDPLGASSNDYDLLLVHPTRATIVYQSLDLQTGSQDPVECIGILVRTATGGVVNLLNYRIAIIKATASVEDRYLHMNLHGGGFQLATPGTAYGHAAAANAVSVAASDATAARGAGGVFNGTESVEIFSSDGPRRIFFYPNGRAITPGNFSSRGGLFLRKPDVTAADGVRTSTPGFAPFYGTSAAAPHAAAIAALMLQAAGGPRSLTRAQLLKAMQDTALDIEASGVWDRDSGAGIIDALAAVGTVRRTQNRPPVPVGILSSLTLSGSGPAVVDVSQAFRDPDGDALTYSATSSAMNVATVSVSGARVTVMPVSSGSATVTVTAMDPAGASAIQQFTVTVTGSNQPPVPVGSLPNLTLHVNGPAVVDISRAFRDPDGDALNYSTTSTVTNVAVASVTGTQVMVMPAAPGSTMVTVAATDAGGATASQQFTVTVSDGRQFTDHPIQRGTPVRAVHFLELRDRIGVLRARSSLPAFRWTDPVITAGATPVRRVHLTELRTALGEAFDAVGRPRPEHADTTLTAIMADHLMELRTAVTMLESGAR